MNKLILVDFLALKRLNEGKFQALLFFLMEYVLGYSTSPDTRDSFQAISFNLLSKKLDENTQKKILAFIIIQAMKTTDELLKKATDYDECNILLKNYEEIDIQEVAKRFIKLII